MPFLFIHYRDIYSVYYILGLYYILDLISTGVDFTVTVIQCFSLKIDTDIDILSSGLD